MPPTLLALLFWFKSSAAHSAHSGHMPPWLIHLGMPGLFVVSLLDAAIIPLPLPGSGDVLLLLLCAQTGSHPVLLAALAIGASVLGGYTTWKAGQKGGEAMLNHFAPKRMIRLVNKWMRGHGFLTIAASAVAPPPIPLMPLLLGAGAFGATRRQYFTAFSLARGARYGLVAWVGATYGRHVLRVWDKYLSRWSAPVLWTFIALLLAAMIFGFWQYRRQSRSWQSGGSGGTGVAEPAAT